MRSWFAVSIPTWPIMPGWKSLNPESPSLLSHLINTSCPNSSMPFSFFSFTWPHQNYLTILVSSSYKELGSLKQDIVWDGTTWAMTFIKTSFPALESSFSFHPANLFATRCFKCAKVFCFDLPIRDGRPRLNSWDLVTCAPNIAFIDLLRTIVRVMVEDKRGFVLVQLLTIRQLIYL